MSQWNRLLIVKNLSNNCTSSRLQSYLETEADLKVTENGVQFMWGIKHTALVTLAEKLTERRLTDLVNRVLRQKPLEGKRLVFLPVKYPPTSIFIQELDAGLSEEYLILHFDNRRSGGVEGGVLDDGVEVYPELKLAVVNFVTNEVVQGVLAVTDHILKGKRLFIEPCYAEYHLPLIHELLTRSRRGESRDAVSQATPSPVFNPIVYAASGTVNSTSDSMREGVNELYDCDSDLQTQRKQESVKVLARRFNQLPAERGHQARKSEDDHSRRKSLPQFGYTGYTEHPSNATMTRNPGNAPCLGEAKHNASGEMVNPKPKHRVSEKKYDTDERWDSTESYSDVAGFPDFSLNGLESLEVMSSMDDVLDLDFTESSRENLVHTDHHGSENKVSTKTASDDQTDPELLAKFENLKLENERLKQQVTSKQLKQVEVPAYKLALLKDFAKTDHGCAVKIQSEGLVLLHGMEEECDAARCQLLMLVQSLSECMYSAPPPIIKLVRSAKGSRYLTSIQQNHSKCSMDIRETHIVFAACESQDAEDFMQDFKKRILQISVQVHAQTLHNANFPPLKTQLENEYLVCLTLPVDDSEVVEVTVDGFEGDVDLAVREVKKHNDTYKPDVEVFDIPGTLARRACDTWFAKELDEVKTLILKNDGDVTRLDTDGLTLTFLCRLEVLKVTREKLSAIKENIVTSSLNLKSRFKLYSDCALVINGLQSHGVEQFCLHLERVLSEEEDFPVLISMTLPSQCSLPEIRLSPEKGAMHSDHQLYSGHSVHHSSKPHSGRRGNHRHSHYMQPQSVTLGNAAFMVKSGNITREKVDVLVNIVGEDLKMNTAVGSAIYKRYPQVGKLLLAHKGQIALGGDQCQVFLTHIPPDKESQPSIVLHAVLKKCAPNAVATNVKQIVRTCLQLAIDSGALSISFPPLGCGRMFRYPDGVVANTMISSITEFLQASPATLQKVTIIAYDAELARIFRDMMHKKLTLPSDTEGATAAADTTFTDEILEQNDNEEPDDAEKDQESDGITFASQDDAKDSRTVSGKFEASICTRQPADCHDIIKVKLVEILQRTFLYTDSSIKDCANFQRLNAPTVGEIKSAAAKNNVVLTMKDSRLHVCGEKASVKDVVALISNKLLEYRAMLDSAAGDHRRKIGLPVDTCKLPSYWESSKKTPSKKQLLVDSNLKDVTAAELKAVEGLVMATWENDKVGAGADARSLSHTGIKVLGVQRLENLSLWEQFSEQREKLFRRLEKRGSKAFEQLSAILPKGPLLTTQKMPAGSLLTREIYHQVNEYYLLHGTKTTVVKGICRDGLDGRLANDRTMLGRGVYVAESATKSDQYTDLKTGRSGEGEILTMILVRILLGEPFVNKNKDPPKFKRPPCKTCSKDSCSCDDIQFDSVIDDATRIFREFVVYDKSLCYPEYFVTYQRV